MIKHIKNFICGLFGIKQCACPEDIDPHEELYLKPAEPETPVYENEEAVKAEHCSGHKRFRKTCPLCLEIVK
tara:strand:- start:640 stop:855 length:216 start_codon:yes stop_codon:yes gene_type:complete